MTDARWVFCVLRFVADQTPRVGAKPSPNASAPCSPNQTSRRPWPRVAPRSCGERCPEKGTCLGRALGPAADDPHQCRELDFFLWNAVGWCLDVIRRVFRAGPRETGRVYDRMAHKNDLTDMCSFEVWRLTCVPEGGFVHCALQGHKDNYEARVHSLRTRSI